MWVGGPFENSMHVYCQFCTSYVLHPKLLGACIYCSYNISHQKTFHLLYTIPYVYNTDMEFCSEIKGP